MGVPYSKIYGRFATKVQDYTLDAMFRADISAYEAYLQGWLQSAIVKFMDYCKFDLTDRNDIVGEFNQPLGDKEVEMLSFLMVVEWSEKEVKNVTDMRLRLNSSDFKSYSESNNLKTKQDLQNVLIERADKYIVDYSYHKIDLSGLGGQL